MSLLLQDVLWIIGVLLVALACVWYARRGLRTGDALLVAGGMLAAFVFFLAAVLYWWLVWGS